ncbi:MAG: hypothetical protein U1E62_08120 [Alsobacter sp.]
MFARVPVSVSVPVPEPETVTLPTVVADREPELTPRVTVIVPEPASTSDADRPVNWTLVSSFVVNDEIVFTGASLTAVTFTVLVRVAPLAEPSLTT